MKSMYKLSLALLLGFGLSVVSIEAQVVKFAAVFAPTEALGSLARNQKAISSQP